MTNKIVIRPSHDEDSRWCQEHGHTGIDNGCRICVGMLRTDVFWVKNRRGMKAELVDSIGLPVGSANAALNSADTGHVVYIGEGQYLCRIFGNVDSRNAQYALNKI